MKFNPAEFIGKYWSIESDNGNNPKDLKGVVLKSYLKPSETYITGDEVLKRQEETPLNADAFLRLWEHQELIPPSWKEKINGNTAYIFFDGTILRDPYGDRNSLSLFWNEGRWSWNSFWLGGSRDAGNPSAIVASSTQASDTQDERLDPMPLILNINGIEYRRNE